MFSELDIIRHMLVCIGETAESSLLDTHPSVVQARAVLESANFDMQTKVGGWWFNSDKNLRLVPNEDNHIVLPNQVLEFSTIDTDWGYEGRPDHSRFVARDGKVYDKVNHTFEITRTLRANITSLLPVDEVPAVYAVALKHRAAYDLYNNEDGDPNKLQRLGQTAEMARIELNKADIRSKRLNVLQSPFAQTVQYRQDNIVTGFIGERYRHR